MKKLYLNIRDIEVDGRPEDVLPKPINSIDISVEEFFTQTETLFWSATKFEYSNEVYDNPNPKGYNGVCVLYIYVLPWDIS